MEALEETGPRLTMRRSRFHDELSTRPDRLSPQELQMLMQIMPEDEDGCVCPDILISVLESLRSEALHNSLVESDVGSLRKHLILLVRRHGLTADSTLPQWVIKKALLQADQLCLSRMQIHVILCLMDPGISGYVDVRIFLRICCTVIPYLFDTEVFNATAQRLSHEQADAARRAELLELEQMAGSAVKVKGGGAEGEEDGADGASPGGHGGAAGGQGEEPEVDREQVEKTLLHVFGLLDETHRGVLPVETMFKALHSGNDQVQGCQLSDKELRGLSAEMNVDENGDVVYAELIKTWVPIIFELRRSPLYEPLLRRDPFVAPVDENDLIPGPLIDLTKYEEEFPLLPPELIVIGGGSKRRDSKERRNSLGGNQFYRRPSKEDVGGGGLRRASTSKNLGSGEEVDLTENPATNAERRGSRSNLEQRMGARRSLVGQQNAGMQAKLKVRRQTTIEGSMDFGSKGRQEGSKTRDDGAQPSLRRRSVGARGDTPDSKERPSFMGASGERGGGRGGAGGGFYNGGGGSNASLRGAERRFRRGGSQSPDPAANLRQGSKNPPEPSRTLQRQGSKTGIAG